MRWHILLALLLLPAFASAELWTVAYDDAPVTDVISAANFAASMKASVGEDFTGLTFSQAQEEATASLLQISVVVIFDGNKATIMAASGVNTNIVNNAEVYLRDQGFAVDIVDPDIEFFGVEEPEPEPEPVVEEEPEEDLPVVVIDEPEPEPLPPPTHDPVVEPEPEEPGFFGKIWDWFAGLFS